jgi:hypothetical protein
LQRRERLPGARRSTCELPVISGHLYKLVGRTVVACGHFNERVPANHDIRRVAHTAVDKYRISTVFLGVNRNWSRNGPPIIFETMAFDERGKSQDWGFYQYSTYDEAERGHKQVVDWASAHVATDIVPYRSIFSRG